MRDRHLRGIDPDTYHDLIPQSPETRRISLDGLQRGLLAICLLLLFALTVVMVQIGSLNTQLDVVRQSQKDGQDRGYRIRAVSCQSLAYVVHRDGLPEVCLEPAVLAYYNPDATLPSTSGP